jgi:hypothetical protein
MIDELRLHRALDGVLAHLVRLGRPVASLLQPALTSAEIAQREAGLPFALTEEVRSLYRWRNGTRAQPGDILGDLWFFPGYYLLSLDEAIQVFHERKLAPQWRKGWFPLFADGAGDFFIVPCERRGVDAKPVIGFIHGEPQQDVEYLDVTTMIETLLEAYDRGAFFLDCDGSLEVDDDAYARIARQHNPGVAEWEN